MKLTPISVPGKRRHAGDVLVDAQPKRARHTPKLTSQPSREARASYLEKLPLEVLENIFWMSGNINLPRASPRVGRMLSGRPTLRETFITAFVPTWDAWFNIVRDRAYIDECVQGDPVFQSGILQYSWTNIAFILECWNIYVRRRANGQLRNGEAFHCQHPRIWGDPGDVGAMGREDDECLVDPDEASLCFFHDYAAFHNFERRNSVGNFAVAETALSFFQVHKNTRIPDTLLESPWTDETLQKLFWLVRGGARLSPEQTWELTSEGWRNAVPRGIDLVTHGANLTAVRLLGTLNIFHDWPESLNNEELDNAYNCFYHHKALLSECATPLGPAHRPTSQSPSRYGHNSHKGSNAILGVIFQAEIHLVAHTAYRRRKTPHPSAEKIDRVEDQSRQEVGSSGQHSETAK
ncbi:hypothetical protein GGR54DRAFT_642383 [Hypoxylon sp. NC1633]|nr:hypothetical protein GGR54DRAFT_642383 [Hypoxylon sp. NC1633]